MLLSHEGGLQFLVGVSPGTSSYTAPEICAGQKIITCSDFEKVSTAIFLITLYSLSLH